jgi:hypothetical protein
VVVATGDDERRSRARSQDTKTADGRWRWPLATARGGDDKRCRSDRVEVELSRTCDCSSDAGVRYLLKTSSSISGDELRDIC